MGRISTASGWSGTFRTGRPHSSSWGSPVRVGWLTESVPVRPWRRSGTAAGRETVSPPALPGHQEAAAVRPRERASTACRETSSARTRGRLGADGAARDPVAGRARQEGVAGVGRVGAVVEPEVLPTAGGAFGPGARVDVGPGAARPVGQPPRPVPAPVAEGAARPRPQRSGGPRQRPRDEGAAHPPPPRTGTGSRLPTRQKTRMLSRDGTGPGGRYSPPPSAEAPAASAEAVQEPPVQAGCQCAHAGRE
ncbi:hypothetical protein SUDANB148_04918 [Streptomyces sp. SudanB148_2056]